MQTTSTGNPIVLLVMLAIWLAVYVFYSYCLKRLVEKCGENPGAIIWVPILQMIPLFRIAKMNPWMILLMLIPVVNLVIIVMVWIKVLAVLGREPVMVLVMLFFGFIYLPYLALSSSTGRAPAVA